MMSRTKDLRNNLQRKEYSVKSHTTKEHTH